MRYKDKHFYTTSNHIDYMVRVEKLNQTEINFVLREYWKLSNIDIISVIEYYENGINSKRERGNVK